MKRRLIAAGLFLMASATFLPAFIAIQDEARQGTVITADGQRIDGLITETRDAVTIVRKGGSTVLPRDTVVNIDYSTYAEQFARIHAALASDDVDGRMKLARDAFDRREYALADKVVQEAIDINPLNREAMEFSRTIGNQLTLEAGQRRGTTAPASPAAAPTTTPAPSGPRLRGLSREQINVVRQMELQADDEVRIQFQNNARKAFVDSQPGMTFKEFNTQTDVKQAIQILTKGSPDLRRDIYILNDPRTIRSFAGRLHTAVVQGCATSQCHGGNAAGDFKLFSGTPDASMLVTNFYILTTYKRKDTSLSGSVFAPDVHPMIERGKSQDSLLYQYSMPRDRARLKHPEVRKFNGLFVNESDRLAKDMQNWIDNELSVLKPDYGFEFSLLPATQPSTQPGAEPVAEEETAGDTNEAASQPTTSPVLPD